MEPKKIKKLVLKKETIASLSSFEQSRIIGAKDSCGGLICVTKQSYAVMDCALCDAVENGSKGGGNGNTYLYSVPYAVGNCPYPPPPESGYQWCPSELFNSCDCW